MTLELLAGLWVAAAILFIKSTGEFKVARLGEENYFYIAGTILLALLITFGSFGMYGGEQLISTVQTSGCCEYSQSAYISTNITYTYQTIYFHNTMSASGGIALLFMSIVMLLATMATARIE